MAINVYLVFFHRFDAIRLKKLYWLYGLICYGLPFIPAIFCLFYSSKNKGKMYGDATVNPPPSFPTPYPFPSLPSLDFEKRVARLITDSSGAGSTPLTPPFASTPTTHQSGSRSSSPFSST
jgi:hypothetical protein